MKNPEEYFKIASKAANEAAGFLLVNFGNIKAMTHKHDGHYGIDDDKVANNIYERFLKKSTPEIGLYTEEGKRDLSKKLTWVVDPLEGTSNYRVGIPFFATQICLLEKTVPIMSVLIAPKLSQVFTAIKGKGTFLNGNRVYITQLNSLDKVLINIGRGTKSEYNLWYYKTAKKIIPKVRTIRSLGSCGLELAYCASGKIDAVLYNGSQPYDYATGALLVKEAGGRVLNDKGKDWTFNDKFLLASNKQLASKIKKIIL